MATSPATGPNRPHRIVEGACRECLASRVYCQCVREIDRQPCCDACTHDD